LENNNEILINQHIWESLALPKDYHLEKQLPDSPVIFFVITGNVCFKTKSFETHSVLSQEMYLVQINNSFEIIMLEQTHLIMCHVPVESWFTEQKWIELISDTKDIPEKFFKLPIKKTIFRYLTLVELYLKDNIQASHFFDLKRQELFFLFFYYYQKNDMAQFLRCIISNDIQFKKFVMTNYLHAGNVQVLAKLANYSTSGFIKKFRKCFNESPYKWMQKQKAKQIYIDIYQGIKSLQEIANEYKFSSYQHFSVFCKMQLGAPPTEILVKSKGNDM
jgi:AraC-like DNA-binding protein